MDKYIYLGQQPPQDYTPIVNFPQLKQFVKPKKKLLKYLFLLLTPVKLTLTMQKT